MARTTYQHNRITAFEIDGKPVEIASAELTRVSMLDGDDEVINLEWEVSGRTQESVPDGVHDLAMTINGRRHVARGIFRESHAEGWTVFKVVGLDALGRID